MNFEDDYVKHQMQNMKGVVKKKDRHLVEESLRKEYCEQNNIQYIPKEQHKQGKANEKYTYQVKDKNEARGQLRQDVQKQQDNQQEKQQQSKQQRQQKQNEQREQREEGDQKDNNKKSNNFQNRKNNKQQHQKGQGQQDKQQHNEKQQNEKQGNNNQQRHQSHNNNQPFVYPYTEGQQNNDHREVNDNHNDKERRNDKSNQQNRQNTTNNNNKNRNNNNQENNNQQRNQNNKSNTHQTEHIHYKQVRRDRRAEKHIRSVQSDQNKQFNKKRFNHYKNNNFDDDYNRLDEENSFEDDYYYKKEEKNQKQNYQRREYDQYGFDRKNNNDKRNNNNNNNRNWKGGRNNKKNRKNQDFEEYWTEKQIEKGKAENDIFEGIFIANEFTREKATIKCPIFKKKVHINSFIETNRAFHGALVAFKITKIKKTDEESEDDFEEEITQQIPLKNKKNENKKEIQQEISEKEENNDDWEDVDSQQEEEDDISEVSDLYVVKKVPLTKLQKLQKAQLVGKVVGVIKNPLQNRHIIGKLKFDEKQKSQVKEIKTKEELINYLEQNYYISFKCVNKRISFFNVKNLLTFNYELDNQEPVQKFIDYVSQRYFSAKFISWEKRSRYPYVELIKEVGVQGNIDVECEAILIENSVYDNEFSESCKEEMKAFTHDSIAKEREKRMDLTKEYICSIDPVTARDLDDALSINDLGNGIYEIGVQYNLFEFFDTYC